MAKNEIEYTAVNGHTVVDVANSNLDGTGTLSTVLTGSNNGTKIDRIYIKATDDVTQGMVRLFLDDGTNTRLLREVSVPAVDQRGVTPSFSRIIRFPNGLTLPLNWNLKASTENSESFVVTAIGSDWDYPESESKIEWTGADTINTVSVANSNLNGDGTLVSLITGSDKGSSIKDITVKAVGNSTIGMVRLFLYDGVKTWLFMEVKIPTSVQSSVVPAFSRKINFRGGGFLLKKDWSIKASTEIAESFSVSVNASSWDYI